MTIEQMRKIVSTDFETKDLEVNDQDLFIVYRYITLRDSHYEKDGYVPVLRTIPYIEISMEPTIAQTKKMEMEKIKKELSFFDTTTYIQNASLSLFKQSTVQRKKAYQESLVFIKEYLHNKTGKGLYLYGRYGTGKSYLLSAIATELIKNNISVLFIFMPDFTRNIKQGIVENNLEQRINQLKQVDVLMLDDLGGENMTTWFRDEVLMPVIQYRLSTGLPLFISSNFNLEGLLKSFTEIKDTEDYYKGLRLIRRIEDLTIYLPLDDDNY